MIVKCERVILLFLIETLIVASCPVECPGIVTSDKYDVIMPHPCAVRC